MPRQLLVVRHAIALERHEAAARAIRDAERPLTARGQKRLRQVAGGLAGIIDPPSLILSSPLVRARRSAELLGKWLPGKPGLGLCNELTPGYTPEQLTKTIANRHPGGLLVLVGHEPQLSAFIALLLCSRVSSRISLKKSGTALLRFEGAIGPGRATLEWLMQPRQLRRLS